MQRWEQPAASMAAITGTTLLCFYPHAVLACLLVYLMLHSLFMYRCRLAFSCTATASLCAAVAHWCRSCLASCLLMNRYCWLYGPVLLIKFTLSLTRSTCTLFVVLGDPPCLSGLRAVSLPKLVCDMRCGYCRGVYQGEPMEMEAEAESEDKEEETEVVATLCTGLCLRVLACLLFITGPVSHCNHTEPCQRHVG